MNFTLHQLAIFKKIANTKSVTKASEELFLTQPAVSIQLKKFQEQFNIPLFEIVGRRLYITEFGEEIAEAASKILNEVDAIQYKAALFDGELAGKLKIAIVSTANYALPKLMAGFIKKHQMVAVTMDVTNKMSVIRSLENNECDFAMVSTIPKKLKTERITLMKNKLYFVASKAYKMPKNLAEINTSIFIFRETGSATRIAMERFLIKHKIEIKRKMELTSNETVKQAVIAGLGISLMPIIGIKNELEKGDLQLLNIKELPLETNWNLIWLKSKNQSLVAKAFKKHIEETKDASIKNEFSWIENY